MKVLQDSFKELLQNHCVQLLYEKLKSLERMQADLTSGASNEAKSSAGDKHETSLSMAQLEQEKLSKQQTEYLNMLNVLKRNLKLLPSNNCGLGSLVSTNQGFFFLSVALGKISIDGKIIWAISPESPLGKKILGLKILEIAELNGISYQILDLI